MTAIITLVIVVLTDDRRRYALAPTARVLTQASDSRHLFFSALLGNSLCDLNHRLHKL